jgi:hypothetical protein
VADYYSLIKQAVARLEPASPREDRWAIYERARAAQLAQLRSISPPLSEPEITQEQRALEEALRMVEAEAAQSTRDIRIPVISDLVTAAEDIGKPIARAEDRPLVAQAGALASAFSPDPVIEMPPPTIVSGGATGRLIRYWRWRARTPRIAAPKRVGGR